MKDTPHAHESLIGATVTINGTVRARQEQLTVMGTIHGVIDHDRCLQIHEQAQIDAQVRATEVQVNGIVTGQIYGTEQVVIGATGQVNGDVYTRLFSVDEGATLKGNVIMESARDAVDRRFHARHPAKAGGEMESPLSSTIVLTEPGISDGAQADEKDLASR